MSGPGGCLHPFSASDRMCSQNASRENGGRCMSVQVQRVMGNALYNGWECKYCEASMGPWCLVKEFCSVNYERDCWASIEKENRPDGSLWTRQKCYYCGRILSEWECLFAPPR